MKKLFIFLALTLISTTACEEEYTQEEKKEIQIKETSSFDQRYIFNRLTWFYLPDGTPCLCFNGYEEGSIDCNWNYKNNQQEGFKTEF